jgi:hypothetical protein
LLFLCLINVKDIGSVLEQASLGVDVSVVDGMVVVVEEWEQCLHSVAAILQRSPKLANSLGSSSFGDF